VCGAFAPASFTRLTRHHVAAKPCGDIGNNVGLTSPHIFVSLSLIRRQSSSSSSQSEVVPSTSKGPTPPSPSEVVENIGGHGIVAMLRNGPGRTVLVRSELDALPICEETDLPYSSKVEMEDPWGVERPVMHACAHDMHATCLLAASFLLLAAKESWSGTLLLLFQPNEKWLGGA
jgi:hypothetical protein